VGINYALRTLRRSPAFSVTAVLTLALGIGAGTGVFSAMDRLLLRRLPYPSPGRLLALHETLDGRGFRPVSLPNLLDWRAQSTSFDGVAGYMTRTFGLGTAVTVVTAGMVTSDLFHVLGGAPRLGRTFSEREELAGERVIVFSDDLWARQFQRAPGIVGSTVQLNAQPYEVIGILPADFVYPAPGTRVDAYIPISHSDYGARGARPLRAVARLKPASTLPAAQAELRAIGARLAAAWPADNARGGAAMESLDEAWKGDLRRPLLLLSIAALLLLAIVCTNVVSLILARSLARAREMEIRVALGAGLADLLRQLLAEAFLLCAVGGASGLLLAGAVLRGLPIILPQPAADLDLDARALAFASAVCLLVTLLCGLAPALSSGRHRRPFRLRQGLMIGQVALSLVLLLSAGAFLRVFLKLVNRYPGFDSSHLVSFGFGLPEGRYDDRQTVEFHRQLRARLSEIPGVESAGAAWQLPLNGRDFTTTFQFEGAGLAASEWPAVAVNIVDPAWFTALRIPLLKGRSLAWDTDRPDRPPALEVNRAFEKMYARGGGLPGKRVQLRFFTGVAPANQLWQIAGVVGDTYQAGLDHAIRPQIYLPISQTGLDGGTYALRTTRTGPGLAAAVSAAVRSVDPNLERVNLRSVDDRVRASLAGRRLPAMLTGLFAAIGLALTALGLYGTMALEVGQRRKEMAIRAALGASRASIAGLVLKRGLLLTIGGAMLGALGFAAAGRAIETQLYEVAPADPMNVAAAAVVLLACAVCACLRPAWDAVRQAPVTVLREM
jgi:predicted permease